MNTYLDLKDAYDAALATLTADATTMATAATNWIENLATFTGWPFTFILQNA